MRMEFSAPVPISQGLRSDSDDFSKLVDSMTDNAGGNGNYTGSNNKKDEFSVKSEAAVKLDKLIGLEKYLLMLCPS